jgi:HEAT repeat protein
MQRFAAKFPRLLVYLHSSDPLVRQTAALVLIKAHDTRARDELESQLQVETDPEARDLLWQALAMSGSEPARKRMAAWKSIAQRQRTIVLSMGSDAAEPLVETFRAGDRETRRWVEAVLEQLGSAADDVLQAALADPVQEIRRLAARVLQKNGWEPKDAAAAAIFSVAAGHYDEARTPEAIPMLFRMLDDAESGEREMAAETLGLIDDERAIDALAKAASDSSARVRERAAMALERFRHHPRAAGVLRSMTDDPQFVVAAAARRALRRAGGEIRQ